jgi:5-enolpyruvylshikimate-3-phosphate synthase
MSLSVAALVAAGTTEIEGSECEAGPFPEFYALLEKAAGRA